MARHMSVHWQARCARMVAALRRFVREMQQAVTMKRQNQLARRYDDAEGSEDGHDGEHAGCRHARRRTTPRAPSVRRGGDPEREGAGCSGNRGAVERVGVLLQRFHRAVRPATRRRGALGGPRRGGERSNQRGPDRWRADADGELRAPVESRLSERQPALLGRAVTRLVVEDPSARARRPLGRGPCGPGEDARPAHEPAADRAATAR